MVIAVIKRIKSSGWQTWKIHQHAKHMQKCSQICAQYDLLALISDFTSNYSWQISACDENLFVQCGGKQNFLHYFLLKRSTHNRYKGNWISISDAQLQHRVNLPRKISVSHNEWENLTVLLKLQSEWEDRSVAFGWIVNCAIDAEHTSGQNCGYRLQFQNWKYDFRQKSY